MAFSNITELSVKAIQLHAKITAKEIPQRLRNM